MDWDNTGVEWGGLDFSQPQIATVADQSSGWNFSDVLRSVNTGVADIAQVWQSVKTTESAINQQQFQNELAAAKSSLERTQALGTLSVQQKQAEAAISNATRNAQAQAIPGGVVTPKSSGAGVSMGLLIALGAGFFLLARGRV